MQDVREILDRFEGVQREIELEKVGSHVQIAFSPDPDNSPKARFCVWPVEAYVDGTRYWTEAERDLSNSSRLGRVIETGDVLVMKGVLREWDWEAPPTGEGPANVTVWLDAISVMREVGE